MEPIKIEMKYMLPLLNIETGTWTAGYITTEGTIHPLITEYETESVDEIIQDMKSRAYRLRRGWPL